MTQLISINDQAHNNHTHFYLPPHFGSSFESELWVNTKLNIMERNISVIVYFNLDLLLKAYGRCASYHPKIHSSICQKNGI